MSKQKGKDKKQQNYDQLEKQFQNQKRELLDATFTIKKLQERLGFLTQDNHRLEKEREHQYITLTQKIEELSIKNETNQKRLITMRNDLTNSQVENKKLINTVNLLEKNITDDKIEKSKELQEMKKNHNFEITKYENMLTDFKLYMSERDAREKEINDLYELKQIEVANRIREVADKEREKVQATDKIRDEMGNKIREMRQNLLSLKKEQLETTTRLTMLQNHQLTSQLEYQSKQTQKIVFKNEELEQTIAKLRQQLQIHKQIEQQLAKRSHFSKGVIKKLHSRVQQLEDQLGKQKSNINANISSSNELSFQSMKQKGQRQQKNMTQAMDKQLEKWQKKYAEIQSRYDCLKKQKDELSLRWETSQRTKNELFNTLLKTFKGLVNSEQIQSQTKQNQSLSLDLNKVRQINPDQWSSDQRKAILQILLVTCQPYLTSVNINLPQLRKIIITNEEKQKQFKSFLPRFSTDRDTNKRLVGSMSQKKLCSEQDICTLTKNELCKQKYGINIASKMVINRLREWGKQVPSKNKSALSKKYQLSCTYRV